MFGHFVTLAPHIPAVKQENQTAADLTWLKLQNK